MTPARDSHCGWCGARFAETGWPRRCAACDQPTYKNPLPVAVLLLPVDDGVLVVRRAIEPRKGQLALPGGFINHGESWQAAAARELAEETGIACDPVAIRERRVLSAPDGTLLVFGEAPGRAGAELSAFAPNDEVSELVILRAPEELAFPLHTQVVREWFAGVRGPGDPRP